MSDTLRTKIIRLSHTNPELRPHLLPLLKEATTPPADRKKKIMAIFKRFKGMGDGMVLGGKHKIMLAAEGYETVVLEDATAEEIDRLFDKYILRVASHIEAGVVFDAGRKKFSGPTVTGSVYAASQMSLEEVRAELMKISRAMRDSHNLGCTCPTCVKAIANAEPHRERLRSNGMAALADARQKQRVRVLDLIQNVRLGYDLRDIRGAHRELSELNEMVRLPETVFFNGNVRRYNILTHPLNTFVKRAENGEWEEESRSISQPPVEDERGLPRWKYRNET